MARGTHEALPDERNEYILVYINGEFYRREEAKISVFDGAKAIDLDIGMTCEEITETLRETVRWQRHQLLRRAARGGVDLDRLRTLQPPEDQLPARLEPLLEECLPLYRRLRTHATVARAVRSGGG